MIHLDFTIQQVWTYAGPVAGGLLKYGVDEFSRYRRERKEKRKSDPVADALKHNVKVDDKLNSLLTEYGCDRITIIQFHNGGNLYPSGQSMMKFSVMYETTRNGIQSVREKFQNIPVSIFSKAINFINENDRMIIQDMKKLTLEEADTLGISKAQRDEKSIYVFAIKSLDDKLVGFLNFSYCTRKKYLSDPEIADLQLKAAVFGSELIISIKK